MFKPLKVIQREQSQYYAQFPAKTNGDKTYAELKTNGAPLQMGTR